MSDAQTERLRDRYRDLDRDVLERRKRWNEVQVALLEKAKELAGLPKLRELHDEAVEDVQTAGEPVTNWNVAEEMAEDLDAKIDLSEIRNLLGRLGVVLRVAELADRYVFFAISLAVAWWISRGERGKQLQDFGPYKRAKKRLEVLDEMLS